MGRLKEKVAIVTGASSGIGRAIAIGFAKEGAKVVVADINKNARPEGYEADIDIDTDEVIRNNGGESIFVKTDVMYDEQVKNLVDTTIAKFGRLDIMVNNAATFTQFARAHELTDYDWDITMGVNAKGTWNGCRQACAQFIKQGYGGKIVNIASIGGIVGLALEGPYCSAKGAVINMTRQLALDYAKDRITVNAINPGFTVTAICREFIDMAPENKATVANNLIPMGRWGEVEDLVGPAIFLASSDSDYVTGQNISVDGGHTIKGS